MHVELFKTGVRERKDTVLISLCIPGWSWHVEKYQPGIMGFIYDNLIEFDCCVHAPHIGVIPAEVMRHIKKKDEGQKNKYIVMCNW